MSADLPHSPTTKTIEWKWNTKAKVKCLKVKIILTDSEDEEYNAPDDVESCVAVRVGDLYHWALLTVHHVEYSVLGRRLSPVHQVLSTAHCHCVDNGVFNLHNTDTLRRKRGFFNLHNTGTLRRKRVFNLHNTGTLSRKRVFNLHNTGTRFKARYDYSI